MADRGDESTPLCADCVGEAFLSGEIRRQGRDAVCFYCEREGMTLTLDEIADRVEHALNEHFYRTATEATGLEYTMMKEGERDWEREGEPLDELIENYAEVEPEVAEDIHRVLARRHYDHELAKMGEEQPFGEEAQYAEGGVDDTESQLGWLRFVDVVKTEARYFSRTAQLTLQSIFEGITAHETRGDRPIIVKAGPGTAIQVIYRARVFQSDAGLEKALRRPDKELGPPPFRSASAGRMNAHGISVFYGAVDPGIALAEVRPPVASRVMVGRFEITKPLQLLDVEALREVTVDGSVFDPAFLSRLQKAKFLKWFSRRITTAVMPEDEPFDYLPTQVVADFLAASEDPVLHGIIYPSIQGSQNKSNIVLFHKAARVQPIHIPEGTQISASLYDQTEDGPEVHYWVSEEVPAAGAATTSKSDHEFTFLSEPLDEPSELDDRECVLRLDTSSVEIHHVSAVKFEADVYEVHRHRFEKRKLKF